MINLIGYNITSYLIEWTKLFLACICLLGMRTAGKKWIVGSFCGAATFIIGGTCLFDWTGFFYGFLVGGLAVITVSLSILNKRNCCFVLLIYMCLSIFDVIVDTIVRIFSGFYQDGLKDAVGGGLWINVISFIVILLGVFVKKKYFDEFNVENVPFRYIVLLCIGCFSMGAYITSIKEFVFQEINSRNVEKATIFVLISGLIFLVVIFLLFSLVYKKQLMENEYLINVRLLESQEEYYTKLFMKDEETRKFRHDCRKHMNCMQLLLSDGKYDELNDYFMKINSDFKEFNSGIHTGNRMIDFIANDLQNRMKEVSIKCSGTIVDKIELPSAVLCTVFYNLLSNAMEAAEKTDNKEVELTIKRMEKTLFVIVENDYNIEPIMKNGDFITIKNGAGHGYGVKNIKKSLQEVGGSYKAEYENGKFIAKIIIPEIIVEN